MPPDASIATPRGRAAHSPALWADARRDYLDGDTAEQVCWRYGLKERTFRDRAAREGWRKCDQPDPAPTPDDDPEADQPVDCPALAEDALIRVRRALRLGRAGEAASWMRLHEKLLARLEAERQAVARRDRVARGQGSDGATAPLANALRAVRDHAAIAAGLTGNRLRIVRAHRQGDISDATFDSLFDLQFDAETALRLAIAPPDVRPADPHLPHPDFSTAPDP